MTSRSEKSINKWYFGQKKIQTTQGRRPISKKQNLVKCRF